ncbi:MAG TPA: hypothetical protein VG734_26085 [Lacunisphaera sp.]|nr:hypothetical protein [Lacunisphaera sp.]
MIPNAPVEVVLTPSQISRACYEFAARLLNIPGSATVNYDFTIESQYPKGVTGATVRVKRIDLSDEERERAEFARLKEKFEK